MVTRRGAWENVAVVAAIILGTLIAFSEVLGGERGLYFRDHILVFKPMWFRATAQMLAGHLPVLDPLGASGVPMEQSVAAAFYTPLALLFAVMPFEVAYDWFVWAHFFFLGAGAALLARSLAASPSAAALIGLLCALSGPVLSFENLLTGLQGIAVTPWIGLGVVTCFRRPGVGSAAGLAIASGLQAQALMPELLLFDLGMLVVLVWAMRPPLNRTLLLCLGLAAALGLALAAVDLIPMFAGLARSRRMVGFNPAERSGWALSPLQFIEMLAPGFWAPTRLPFANAPTVTGVAGDPPYFTTLYLGSALSLALAAPWRQRSTRMWGMVAVLSIVVAMGANAPLHRWITELPLLRSGRFAVKYLLFLVPALGLLASFTLAQLETRARALLVAALGQVAAVFVLWYFVRDEAGRDAIAAALEPVGSAGAFEVFSSGDTVGLVLNSMEDSLCHGVFFASCLAIVAFVVVRFPTRIASWRWLVVGLVAVDLGRAGLVVIPGSSVEAQSLPMEAKKALESENQRVVVLQPPPTIHHAGRSYFEDRMTNQGLYGLNDFQNLRRYIDLDLDGQANPTFHGIYRLFSRSQAKDWPLILRRAGVSRIVRSQEDSLGLIASYPDADGRPVGIYDVQDVIPYVHAFSSWTVISLGDGWEERWLDAAMVHDRGIVLGGESSSNTTSRPCSPQVKGQSLLLDSLSIQVDVASDCPVIVVAQEVAVDGWRAEVDGNSVPLLTVEAGYLGAYVESGSHRVVFRYQAFAWSWWPLSAAAALACAILLAFDFVRRRTPVAGA